MDELQEALALTVQFWHQSSSLFGPGPPTVAFFIACGTDTLPNCQLCSRHVFSLLSQHNIIFAAATSFTCHRMMLQVSSDNAVDYVTPPQHSAVGKVAYPASAMLQDRQVLPAAPTEGEHSWKVRVP